MFAWKQVAWKAKLYVELYLVLEEDEQQKKSVWWLQSASALAKNDVPGTMEAKMTTTLSTTYNDQ